MPLLIKPNILHPGANRPVCPLLITTGVRVACVFFERVKNETILTVHVEIHKLNTYVYSICFLLFSQPFIEYPMATSVIFLRTQILPLACVSRYNVRFERLHKKNDVT